MNLRGLGYITVFTLSCCLVGAPAARAQSGPPIVVTQIDYQYGLDLVFTGTVRGAKPVSGATLFYRLRESENADSEPASVSPGDPSLVIVPRDLREQTLPPFSTVLFWWELVFADGTSHVSTIETFNYIDNRFQWQSVSMPRVTSHWVGGDLPFGEWIAQESGAQLARIQEELGLVAPDHIDVYVYPSPQALRSALLLAHQSMTEEGAVPSQGVVLVAAPAGTLDRSALVPGISHQLTHLALREQSEAAYAYVPEWLTEGLATLSEPDYEPGADPLLGRAIAEAKTIPFNALCSGLFATGENTDLGRAQSAAVVAHIRGKHGMEGVSALLQAYAEGAGCSEGVRQVLGYSLEGLEADWLAASQPGGSARRLLTHLGPWLVLGLPVLVVLMLVAISRTRGRPRRRPSYRLPRGYRR